MTGFGDEYVTICVPGKATFMKAIREMIDQAAMDFGFEEDSREQIVMAVDEACTNIVKHGYQAQKTAGKIYLKVSVCRTHLIVEVMDEASRFSSADEKGMNPSEFLTSGESHGFGLYIMHSFMDGVEHEYEEGKGNRLRLIKRLPVHTQE